MQDFNLILAPTSVPAKFNISISKTYSHGHQNVMYQDLIYIERDH